MSGPATLDASTAILKSRYPGGRLPKANYRNFKHTSMLTKHEDFSGENKIIAIQTENPQGSSASYQEALAALEQGTYVKFTVTPVNHYGISRIRGDALKRAAGDAGALVDLWKNETDGTSMTEVKGLEIQVPRNGTGVIGTIDSAVASVTITLSEPADAVNFDLGETLKAVSSSTSLSPTVRSGTAKITGIDRVAGTLTFAAALDTLLNGVLNGDSFVRAGDQASGGTATVLSGAGLWVEGGTSPSTLFGRVRTTDPVRLAGQAPDLTGINMEDALIEAEAKLIVQGFATDDLVCWCNPLDLKELKKTIGGKVTYPRTEMKTTIAGISFRAYEFEGDNGTIKLISNPFHPKGQFLMTDMSDCSLDSMGPAPHLQDYDTNKFLRTGTDDTWQVSFATYGQYINRMPVKSLRGLNWGA
jgi:hypothetical protein